MLQIKDLKIDGYQRVIEAQDPEAGLHCFIAIHDSTLGPAIGGTRTYPYSTREEALADALRLAKTMTYKNAAIPLGFGGAKGVIIADPNKDKTEKLWLAYAEVVNSLEGNFITGENMGTNMEDVRIMHRKTPYVAPVSEETGSGEPSRFAARGVFRGIQAAAQSVWGSTSLQNKEILIQGLGNVGSKLAEFLFWEGAKLLFVDVDAKKVQSLAKLYGAKIVPVEKFDSVACDIFAPCAKGPVVTDQNVDRLPCQVIAGGANSQLQHLEVGRALKEKGILYAPDFIINAGGVINVSMEFEPGGYDPYAAMMKVDKIYDKLFFIFEKSKLENKPTVVVAEEIANYNLQNQIGKRTVPISFNQR